MDNGIPTARYTIVDKVDLSAAKGFHYPLVVKPVDCNSSKGVKRIEETDDFAGALAEAIECSRTKTAVIEEFKSGEEVSADFYIQGETVKFLCATQSKKIKNTNSFTITQSYYPVVDEKQEKKLVEK